MTDVLFLRSAAYEVLSDPEVSCVLWGAGLYAQGWTC